MKNNNNDNKINTNITITTTAYAAIINFINDVDKKK